MLCWRAVRAALLFAVVCFSVWCEAAAPQEEIYRADRSGCAGVPRIRVSFSGNASVLEIIQLLRKLETSVKDGPTEHGEFWLTVPRGKSLEETYAMLRVSSLIEDVMVSSEAGTMAGCIKP